MENSAENTQFTSLLKQRLETLTPQLEHDLSRFLAEALKQSVAKLTFEIYFDGMTTPIVAEAFDRSGVPLVIDETNRINELLSFKPFYSLELQDLTDWSSASIDRDERIIGDWFVTTWEKLGGRSLSLDAFLFSLSSAQLEKFNLQTGKWESTS